MKSWLSVVLLTTTVLSHAVGQPSAAVAKPGSESEQIARRIVIAKSPNSDAAFTPSSVTAWAGDQLTWTNLTTDNHYPGVLNKDGTFVGFLEAPLKPGMVSHVFSPGIELDKDNKQVAYTIHYVCALHRSEHGTIQVIPAP